MNKKEIELVLDERFLWAQQWENVMGRQNEEEFAYNNPNFIAYEAMIELLERMDYDWTRKNGKHRIFKGE